jgi:hypothetical protein
MISYTCIYQKIQIRLCECKIPKTKLAQRKPCLNLCFDSTYVTPNSHFHYLEITYMQFILFSSLQSTIMRAFIMLKSKVNLYLFFFFFFIYTHKANIIPQRNKSNLISYSTKLKSAYCKTVVKKPFFLSCIILHI